MTITITTTIQLNDNDKSEALDLALSRIGGTVRCFLQMGTNTIEYQSIDAADVAYEIAMYV